LGWCVTHLNEEADAAFFVLDPQSDRNADRYGDFSGQRSSAFSVHANQQRRAAMGLLDSLLGSMTSGQNSHSTIGSALLGLLASESGRSTSNEQSANQSPVAISGGLNELVQRFEQSGLGGVIQFWIGSGARSTHRNRRSSWGHRPVYR
jgi:hypothetical protein